MAKKVKITYYSNYNLDLDLYREAYQEENELTDEEMAEVSDDTIYEFLNEQLEMEWDDFCANLKYSKNNENPCVIIGTRELKNERKNIVPIACDDLLNAIYNCINNMDYISIKQNCGHLEVTCVHDIASLSLLG